MIKINDIIYGVGSAYELPYSNSNMSATNVKDAIDELANNSGGDSISISFDNSGIDMEATNLQDAITEIWRELQLRALRKFEVVYMVDVGEGYKEEVQLGSTALLPDSFTPTKSGYTFVGWRKDNTASNNILSECTVDENPLTLWAVFRKAITVTYNGNNSTAGSSYTSTGYSYYNNGQVTAATITLDSNKFTKTNYKFGKWALGSAGGAQYAAGSSITTSSDCTMYAVWIPTKLTGTVSNKLTVGAVVSGSVVYSTAFDKTPSISWVRNSNGDGCNGYYISVTSSSSTGFSYKMGGQQYGSDTITWTWTAVTT